MSEGTVDQGESLEDVATFLSGVEAFRTLDRDQLSRVAASVTHRGLRAGEALIVEGGHPSTQLWVLRDGALDLLRRDHLVTVMTSGELLGYASLLTCTAPAFTVRARGECTLYCIPGDLGIELLSREDGVRWLATTQRDALLYAARSLSPLPEVQTLPVTSVVRGAPQLCDPEMTISEAAELMTAHGRSAILVRARDGLGIVTDVDLREKVVVGGVSRDAPVSAIMSAPVHTIRSDTLAAEASIAMLTLGVNHLPVLAHDGTVVGMVSAGDLMSLEARNPFALRRSLHRARDEDELVAAAGDIPKLFVDLLDARLDAPVLCRVLTILHDALTVRLLELAFERHGAPPVDYAWLVFGSAARHEITLASDQDNGLAYADTDDPAVNDYFRRVAEDVNAGLTRCGVEPDANSVLASAEWRRTLSGWKKIFSDCLEGDDLMRVLRASVCFDCRQAAGRLYVEQALTDIMREAPKHSQFLHCSRASARTFPPPSGDSGRSSTPWWISRRAAFCPSRTWRATRPCRAASRSRRPWAAWPRSATSTGTVPSAVRRCVSRTSPSSSSSCSTTQTRYAGRRPDNTIDTRALRPITRANLQEALREVAAAQTRFPRLASGWRGL